MSSRRIVPLFVVVPSRVLLLDIAAPLEVVRRANLEQDAVQFAVQYVGPSEVSGTSIGIELRGVIPLPPSLPTGAMVLVPGSTAEPLRSWAAPAADDAADAAIVDWLIDTTRADIRYVSICSGALLLGRAGLLDGHECTTHFAAIVELARIAPLAKVIENRLFVESGMRWTSAGIMAGTDLMLHIVASDVGPVVALAIARYLVVYLRRSGTDPQLSPWLEGRNHVHPVIHRAQDAVIADPRYDWSVASLAEASGSSPRNLSRLFNDHAGMSVSAYVNRMRVARAHELITASKLAIEIVAERSGFSSARQLRRAWNRFHPLSPSRLRQLHPGGKASGNDRRGAGHKSRDD